MADYCKACSIEIFGEDYGELAGITARKDWEKGLACSVICEGCGVIHVDPDGNCATKNCLVNTDPRRKKVGHGVPWMRTEPKQRKSDDADGN